MKSGKMESQSGNHSVQPIKTFVKDRLKVNVFNEEPEMGRAAAIHTAQCLNSAISEKGSANLILATGTSQFSFLESLKQMDTDWRRIIVFHLDEYIGIPETHPASFRRYLRERILDTVSPGKIYFINGDSKNLEDEMARYQSLLKRNPVDIACIGIGENGHIAFNDPPVADFNDTLWVKAVELDHACRMQQLGEGWFPSLDEVPLRAVTLTITAIMNCKVISCTVPGKRKAEAVNNTLNSEIDESCPATILRKHPNASLFLDRMSFPG
jgi:glucosamine-6-phosphate deaminase